MWKTHTNKHKPNIYKNLQTQQTKNNLSAHLSVDGQLLPFTGATNALLREKHRMFTRIRAGFPPPIHSPVHNLRIFFV
jgi:hypothetical protein